VKPEDGGAITLWIDRRGRIKVEQATAGNSRRPPFLELLDDSGPRVAVLRLNIQPGDLRVELQHTLTVLQTRLSAARDALAKAKQEYNRVKDECEKEVRLNPDRLAGLVRRKWQPLIRGTEAEQAGYLRTIQFLGGLERNAVSARRKFGTVTLEKEDNLGRDAANAWAAQQQTRPFAGQWLIDGSILLTLNQDANGQVAGRMSIASGQSGILYGRASKLALEFIGVDLRGNTTPGRIQLKEDGQTGQWSLVGPGAIPGSVERLVTGPPNPAWFQSNTGNFAGYWVHPDPAQKRTQNTVLQKQPSGIYFGKDGEGSIVACASGNRIILLNARKLIGSQIREAVLSDDSQKLIFQDQPMGFPLFGNQRRNELIRSDN
jgi:hypothetical protein